MTLMTPNKRDDELTWITNALSAKWKLRFLTKLSLWTPQIIPIRLENKFSRGWTSFPIQMISFEDSQIKNSDTSEVKFSRDTYFRSFRNKDALQYAFLHFEGHAGKTRAGILCSEWKHKSWIGSRNARVRTDNATASKLIENLLKILNRVTECVSLKADFRSW